MIVLPMRKTSFAVVYEQKGTDMKTRQHVGWWGFLITFLVLIMVACGDTQMSELPSTSRTQIETAKRATSSQMPRELRAAYIASVQKEASEEYAANARPGWVEL